jgi:hypothetical protein
VGSPHRHASSPNSEESESAAEAVARQSVELWSAQPWASHPLLPRGLKAYSPEVAS